MKRIALLLFLALFSIVLVAEDSFSEITIKVLKEENSKPVRYAAVVLHAVHDNGKQKSGGQNLKTNSQGETSFNGVPYGKLRVQVIAKGLQTYGQDYDINQPAQ